MPIAIPYKFSDWYGYDKDCPGDTPFSSSVMYSTSSAACFNSLTQTYYHNGGANPPVAGDSCSSNIQGNQKLAAGYYKTSSGGGVYITGTLGVIASLFTCGPTYYPITVSQQANPFQACVWSGGLGNTFYRTVTGPYSSGQVIYSNNSGSLAGIVTLVTAANGGTNNQYIRTNSSSEIDTNGEETCF